MSGRRVMGMLLICLVAGVGCSDKNSVPRGILPRDKMELVMWDMAQADQYAALYLTKDSGRIDRKAETMRLYEEVFRLHEVTPEQFRKSYHYYLDHPELNQLLFDSVIARGVRARSEMYDRPSSQYHPPMAPANLRPGVGVGAPVGPVKPGVARPGEPMGEAMRRMREAASRRQDSIIRRMHVKRDTTKGRP
jgi:hypothetical protein